jgi:hypothetical protein
MNKELLGATKRVAVPLGEIVGLLVSLSASILVIPFVGNWIHVFAYGVPYGHVVPIDRVGLLRPVLGLAGMIALCFVLVVANIACWHASKQLTKRVVCR